MTQQRTFLRTLFKPTSAATILCLLGSILSALTSCGTETGNPVIKRPTTPRNVAQDAVESEFLDLTESLGESDSSTTGLALVESISNDSFSLAGGKLVDSTVNQPSCSADSTKASFVTQRKNEIKKNFKKRGYTLAVSNERSIRTDWTSPNGGLSCVDGRLKKSIRLLEGAMEERTGNIRRSLSRLSSGGTTSDQDYSSASFESRGIWKTTYATLDIQSSTVVISRISEWNLKKSTILNTSEGESSTEWTSLTLPDAPLKIKVERQRTSGELKSKTIETGTTRTTRADGIIVELTYESVVFAEEDSCYPSSGKIRGKVTPATSTGQTAETFEIDFSSTNDEVPELIFSDAKRVSLSGACHE